VAKTDKELLAEAHATLKLREKTAITCGECGTEDMQEVFEAKLVEDMQALVAGELDPEEFHVEHGCPNRFRSFEEAGVLTSDKGFCFDWHGHRVYVTVQVQ